MPTPGSSLERAQEPKPLAAARASDLTFDELQRRAAVLAKSELVPKAYQGKPEAIILVGTYGAELGLPLTTSIQQIDVIENRPDPSAQLRIGLIRQAGHEVRWGKTSDERAVIFGRRREYRGDPDAWVEVEWTIEQARRAELVGKWVERWIQKRGNDGKTRNVKEKLAVGDDRGIFSLDERKRLGLVWELPEWALKEVAEGRIVEKDNWKKYPADMLRARAAKALSRMEFSDVLAALGVDLSLSDRDSELDLDDGPPRHADRDDEEDDGIVDLVPLEDEPEVEPEQTPAPNPEPAPEPPDEPKTPDPDPGAFGFDAGAWDGARWREELGEHGVKLGDGLRKARELAVDVGVEVPSSIDEVTGALGIALYRWLAKEVDA